VARSRLRRVMRPHPGVRIARVAVRAALVTRLWRGLPSALMPGGKGTKDAACHRHPHFTTIPGLRASRSDRGDGRALDCMISDSTVGWNIANRIRANAKKLGVSEVIYRQRIRTVQRESEGRRPDVRPGFSDCQSHGPRGCLRLRRQRSTLTEDSKLGLHKDSSQVEDGHDS
jgi:hypothetical protein